MNEAQLKQIKRKITALTSRWMGKQKPWWGMESAARPDLQIGSEGHYAIILTLPVTATATTGLKQIEFVAFS